MNYWIFTVTPHKSNGGTLSADEMFRQRMKDKFLGPRQENAKPDISPKGRPGNRLCGREKVFAAHATLSSDSFQLSEEEKNRFGHGKEFYKATYGVLLEHVEIWHSPRDVESLVPQLNFIENKKSWYAYLQGGVRQISLDDFLIIREGRESYSEENPPETNRTDTESQFLLESHLEEFIDQNWANINFGAKLVRYNTEEASGRQFPTGPWSIDFLCIDDKTREFVVIELKRGKSSDSVVGQILRYISWVKENIARQDQQVRGIIITREVDDALRYAIKAIDVVSLLTYQVDFKLSILTRNRSTNKAMD